jgi:hypothetical protein
MSKTLKCFETTLGSPGSSILKPNELELPSQLTINHATIGLIRQIYRYIQKRIASVRSKSLAIRKTTLVILEHHYKESR